MLINSKKYVKRRIILALVQYLDTNTNGNYMHHPEEVLFQHYFHARNQIAHLTGIIENCISNIVEGSYC
jgi:hypothetical protein